jgi:16S rRNA (guanine(1405)-N(7))-methyltransferase
MAASDEARRREAAGRGGKASASRPSAAAEGRGELEELVRLVAAGAGYRGLSRELIASVGARELAKRRNLKEAVKTTRSKLHQVTGAYFPRKEYDRWLALLREAAASGEREQVRAACRTILAQHASTRERLPILDELYTRTLGDVAPITSVIDVACGLNPLAIPWMPLAPGAEYRAYDVYPELAAFLNEALPLLGVRGTATVADVTVAPPTEHAQVALVCKALPCLEQLDKAAGSRLLDTLDAQRLLVTYPVRSLGGRGKGMIATYDAQLRRRLEGRGWDVARYEFATELAFVLAKL